jgi:hypothetical protein
MPLGLPNRCNGCLREGIFEARILGEPVNQRSDLLREINSDSFHLKKAEKLEQLSQAYVSANCLKLPLYITPSVAFAIWNVYEKSLKMLFVSLINLINFFKYFY